MRSRSEWERGEQEHNSPRAGLFHISRQITELLRATAGTRERINTDQCAEDGRVRQPHLGGEAAYGVCFPLCCHSSSSS